jgi:hypothetical protein
MRSYLLILFCLFVFSTELFAGKYDATITSGIFGGTPFWSSDNFSKDYELSGNSDFLRWFNNVNINGSVGDFSAHISASRSDGFDIRNDVPGDSKYQVHLFDTKYHLTDTRIFAAYAQYKFNAGYVKAGRLGTFSRWLFGSVDGGAFSYKITDNLNISGFGGKGVRYGLLYDNDYKNNVAYADVSYKFGKFGAKAKYMYSDSASKAGADVYGVYEGVRFSADFGYDVTNKRLFDGSLAIFGYIGKKLSLSANYSRITPFAPYANFYVLVSNGFNIHKDNLINPDPIDRIIGSVSYKIFEGYNVSFRQMFTSSKGNLDYLSYLYLNHKYFSVGINYLGGDTGNKRFGVSLGGNYNILDNLRVIAGISSVDYLFAIYDTEHVQSLATYLKCDWGILDNLTMSANINYYHENEMLAKNLRGGFTFQYRINSGDGK